jgi:hypothetical protein
MPFDDLDKKIIEAADHHHPDYDEQAWLKMKKKLDKHLPEKKDDRRRLLFLLFGLLFLAGGAFFMFNNSGEDDNKKSIENSNAVTKNNSSSEQLQKVQLPATVPGEIDTADPVNSEKIETKGTGSKTIEPIVFEKQLNTETEKNKFPEYESTRLFGTKDVTSLKLPPGERKKAAVKKNDPSLIAVNQVAVQKEARLPENNISGKKSPEIEDIKPTAESVPDVATAAEISKAAVEINKKNNPDSAATAIAVNKNESPEKETKKQKRKGSFIIFLSAGPDISGVSLDKIGVAAIQYGGGIGYNFANGITLRTGFFAGKKIYDADSSDYNPPANWWQYYPGLKNIAADCKVYEIPLFVSYNFKPVKNHNWFVSTGVSSLIMKRETYDYLYKGAWGQYQTTQRIIKNTNKHFFSVLTLSGGYIYNLNKHIAFSAEPYFKMPLTGIGFGKIKLKSAGVLFSMSVKPFSN